MNSKTAVRAIMKDRGFTLQHLADEAGYSNRMAINQRLSTGTSEMRVDSLVKMIEAMGCELVIKSKLKDRKEWRITLEDE